MDVLNYFVAIALLIQAPYGLVHASTGLRQAPESTVAQMDSQTQDDDGAQTQYELAASPSSVPAEKLTPSHPLWYTCVNSTGAKLRLEILPGFGWDALSHETLGFMPEVSYELCQTTPDGIYIIPDTMEAVPIKGSKVKQYSEEFGSFNSYESSTSLSMSLDVSTPIVSGSFSSDYERNKKNQVKYNSVTARAEIRQEFYQVKIKPDASISRQLRNRLLVIGDLMHNNKTQAATHEIELIIRDFGTHMITGVTAGGIFQREVQVTRKYAKSSSRTTANVRSSVSASLFTGSGYKFSYHISKKQMAEFETNVTQSLTRTIGGRPYKSNMTVAEWGADLERSLVGIDRWGDPIQYVVTPYSVPELPAPTVRQISNALAKAAREYTDINIHQGCTDVDSAGFNFKANTGDRSMCHPVPHNYTFGGIYQTCNVLHGQGRTDFCQDLLQKNPSTGDYRCPPAYEPVHFHTGSKTINWHTTYCTTVRATCRALLIIPYSCTKTVCYEAYLASDAVYQTYWCAKLGQASARSGYLFGGIYSDQFPNPVTELPNCPSYFYGVTMGKGMTLCISNDYQRGFEHARSFAGFYSCSTGNPMYLAHASSTQPSLLSEIGFDALKGADTWPKRCPDGYSTKVAAIDDGCQINYCVKEFPDAEAIRPLLLRPPYGRAYPEPGNYTVDLTEVVGQGGQVWRKNITTGVWTRVPLVLPSDNDLTQSSVLESAPSNTNLILIYTLVPSAVVVLALVTALVGQRRRIRHLQAKETPQPPSKPKVTFSAGPSPRAAIIGHPQQQDWAKSFPANTAQQAHVELSETEVVDNTY
ncbi:macrophage-expressed gene 1 protein-like [Sycon ciliatum]|uniref:macrophage-expressed gene 1 protein-like n=1 Tax=Sycon ciliatum TaxID=27933 RepID=UPI0020AB4208|eukprot:scpid40442/ scgid18919/ Macrophage-expressed gene 1 protein